MENNFNLDLSFETFINESERMEIESILEFEEKDRKRVEDFFTKAKGSFQKVVDLATSMAKKITNAEKAFNRGEAAIHVMGTKPGETNEIADIFFARAAELGYDPKKIPTNVKPVTPSEKKPEVKTTKVQATPKTPEKVEITHEPKSLPASKLSADKQYNGNTSPKNVPGKECSGVPVIQMGTVNIAKGTAVSYGENIYDKLSGTVEVWKLNNGQHTLVFVKTDTPSVILETPCVFIDKNSERYLFYGELVDYINIQDMSALIDLYGNVLPGYLNPR